MKFVKLHNSFLILSRFSCIKYVVFVLCTLYFSKINAHGNLSIRIEEKSKEITENPKKAELYFERGFLYQQHYEYKKAIKDFTKSKKLNYRTKELSFRIAETYYFKGDFKKALKYVNECFLFDASDVKTYKLNAQILFKLKKYTEALESFNYVISHRLDLRPEDFIEYATILLATNNLNYVEAINVIDLGLSKVEKNTLTLQLKKLDYLIASNQIEAVINQYNYFILNNTRKEFWYLKKAIYLSEIEQYQEAIISLQQAKVAIAILKPKFQNTLAIKDLKAKINELEKVITL